MNYLELKQLYDQQCKEYDALSDQLSDLKVNLTYTKREIDRYDFIINTLKQINQLLFKLHEHFNGDDNLELTNSEDGLVLVYKNSRY